jgi:hypothetical protein
MTSTLPKGNLGSVASLLAATFYQGNLDRNHKLWNIGYVLLVINTFRSFPHSRLIIGVVTRLTRRVPLVEQKLLTLSEHLSSPPVFSEVRVTRSLVLYICFVDRQVEYSWKVDHLTLNNNHSISRVGQFYNNFHCPLTTIYNKPSVAFTIQRGNVSYLFSWT